jgi:4-amino-4-deoxy-L-arabinose transferase-like glycosyltransferase
MGILDGLTKNRRRVLISVAALLLLASAVRFYHIQWSFSNNGIDEGIMLERALMVDRGYRLYSELPCDQAPLAFYMGSLVGGDVLASRVLVAGLSILAICACMVSSMRMKGSRAMLLTGLLLSLDFVFLRESRLFSLDAISSCLMAFSIPAFLLYIQKSSRSMLALAGLLVGLSTASKLLGALALIGMLAFMLLEARRERKGFSTVALDAVIVMIAAALPILSFMAYLGPSEVFRGMVLDQGQRGFDLFLKLSLVAYFGLNIAYLVPLARARSLWRGSRETRYLLFLVAVVLAFMVLQPLVFLHHMALLSPPLAILAGVSLSDLLGAKKSAPNSSDSKDLNNKRKESFDLAAPVLAAAILISATYAGYGLVVQKEPFQVACADWLMASTGPDDFVISGDPTICAYADRMTPPDVVNVAYRQHDELTLGEIEKAIEDYNVSVVIVCYRLNDVDGLAQYLLSSGFARSVVSFDSGTQAALDLFQKAIGPVTVYVLRSS